MTAASPTLSYLEIASRLGARICRDALWDANHCNWVAQTVLPDGSDDGGWCALDPSLYNGTSGIALFLNRLARATGKRIFQHTAHGALRQALSQVNAPAERFRNGPKGGYFSGLAGIAFALADAGPPFAQKSEEIASIARSCNSSDDDSLAWACVRANQITSEPDEARHSALANQVEADAADCSLCHGLFGRVDALLDSGTPQAIALAHEVAQRAIHEYSDGVRPWPCAIPDRVEIPALMSGLAGIGHTLLRLTDPCRFSSPKISPS